MTAGSTKLIWSWSRRMRSASPTERNYPNAEIVMHENEPAHWFDDEKCKGHQPGAEIVLSGLDGVRFHIEPRRRSLHLAGDHAKANDEIERRQRGKDPRTVKAHRKTGLAQEHADVDRVARVKRYGPFSTIAVSSTVARQKEALTAPVGASDRVPQSRSRQGPPPHARGIARRHRARTRRHPEPRAARPQAAARQGGDWGQGRCGHRQI